MCGRFVSAASSDDLADYFSAVAPEGSVSLHPNYNVAPTAEIYAVRERHAHRHLSIFRWGLVPSWAKELKVGSRMINARSETVADKPAFRAAYKSRRCLIPADAFYEWAKVEGTKTKQPYAISRGDGERLVMAGLWERWYPKDPNDENGAAPVETCTILTCSPNAEMAAVHDRMPVLVPPGAWDRWLDPSVGPADLADLLVPAPDGILTLVAVPTAVNNVRNNGPELLDPLPSQMGAETDGAVSR